MAYDRHEIEAAFARYCEAAATGATTGDWRDWVACFTDDVTYIEHLYGVFHGRDEVLAWITKTMAEWPNSQMQSFPWDWYTIDEAQGWVIGQLQNRMVDPGDGECYQAPNWTRLVYAGDGLFSSEEDVYNPMSFAPMIAEWQAAYDAHH